MPSESDFLSWLKHQQHPTPLLQLPPGDDLAILNWPPDDLLLIGVDQVLDQVHFDSAIHSPRAIGIKAMNRNISDCAAMGSLPAAAVVSFALPRACGLDYAKELYLGLRAAADPFNCVIAGGDTGTWSGKLALSVTILGRSAGITPIRRDGARPGDGIYVTGPLGASIFGRHMTFTPRVHEGRLLAATGIVTAMIDLSDGLSRDLPRICSNAILEAASIPIHPDANREIAGPRPPLTRALHDGEDYELLFTAPSAPPVGTRIGTVTAEGGLQLRHDHGTLEPLHPQAWEHPL